MAETKPTDPAGKAASTEPKKAKGWKATRPIAHDGKRYAPGDVIAADAITEAQAAALTASGAVEAV
ncbi:hypothetical protein [Pinisolibacter sp.]|uniref:hypothetical protein n=1 Tax=Pinisolibacter sp. TaxID=2172024 RepID=UPI002FDEB333